MPNPHFPTRFWLHACVIGALWTSVNLPALADNTLFSATYKGKYSGWNFEMTRKLTQTGEQAYRLSSDSKQTFASITEISDFSLARNQIWPLHYSYKLKALGSTRTEQIDFDWAKYQAITQGSKQKEGAINLAIAPGILDPALYQLKIQQDMANNLTTLEYDFIKRKEQKHYVFKIVGREIFALNNQSYHAVILERQDAGPQRNTRVWLIEELNFQIGRIQHREKPGDTYTIELQSFEEDKFGMERFYRGVK